MLEEGELDFIFSLSRTVQDKQSNKGRMFIAKNRNGPDGIIFPIFMDPSNVKIEVLDQTDDSIEDLNLKAAKKERERLKESYKKFKNTTT